MSFQWSIGKEDPKGAYKFAYSLDGVKIDTATFNVLQILRDSVDYILKEIRKNDGWKEAESGLLYKIDIEGSGSPPKPSDTVKVKYGRKPLRWLRN